MTLIDIRDEIDMLIPFLSEQERPLIPSKHDFSPGSYVNKILEVYDEYMRDHQPSEFFSYLLGRGLFYTGKEKKLLEYRDKTKSVVLNIWTTVTMKIEPTCNISDIERLLENTTPQDSTILYHSLIYIIQGNFLFRRSMINQLKIHSLFTDEEFSLVPEPLRQIIYTDFAYNIFLQIYYKYLMGETVYQQENLERALIYLAKSNNKSIIARFLEFKGLLLFDRGYCTQAYQHFEEGSALAFQADDAFEIAFLVTRFARFYLLEGRYFVGKKYVNSLLQSKNFIFKIQSVQNYLIFTKIMMLIKEENYTLAKEELNTFLTTIVDDRNIEITIRDAFHLLQLLQTLNFEIGVQLVKEKFYSITFYPQNVMKFVIDAIDNKLSYNFFMSLKFIERSISLLSQINDDYLLFLLYVERLDLLLKIQLINWNFHEELFACIHDIFKLIKENHLGKIGNQFMNDIKAIIPSLEDYSTFTPLHCKQIITLIEDYHLNFWLIESNPQKIRRKTKILYLSIIDSHGEVFVDTGGTEDLILVNKAFRQFLETEEQVKTTTMNVDIGKFQIFSITLPSNSHFRLVAVAREIDTKTKESLETASKTIDEELLSIENKNTLRNILQTLLEL